MTVIYSQVPELYTRGLGFEPRFPGSSSVGFHDSGLATCSGMHKDPQKSLMLPIPPHPLTPLAKYLLFTSQAAASLALIFSIFSVIFRGDCALSLQHHRGTGFHRDAFSHSEM